MFDTEDIRQAPVRRHRDYKGLGHRPDALRRWDAKEFIAWDGEGTRVDEPTRYMVHGFEAGYQFADGTFQHRFTERYIAQPQPYVLLANSKGERITNESGLSTKACFEFLLDTKKRYPNSIFVGFGFNYDINQMLRDVPDDYLWQIHDTGHTTIGPYTIKWVPRKSLNVTHYDGRKVIIYDVFGYFGKAFLQVCEKYLGKNDPGLSTIDVGKAHRAVFEWAELDDFIIPYNNTELDMLVRIMNKVREDLHNVEVNPSQWHGPGAVAGKVLGNFSVPVAREIPGVVLDKAQYAYAGGWFEHFKLGRHDRPVYEYDIHSAYPAAAIHLPDLSKGHWEYCESLEPESFGVWNISYDSPYDRSDNRPQPLYCRSKNGSVSHPTHVTGWYWTPEACLVPDSVRGGWVFRPATGDRPFAFIEAMYDQRRLFITQGNPAERALKLILNSIYGKLAQTVGYDEERNEPPRWHQLESAGYITSYTRARIYNAILQSPESIIAVETDAVFSTVPLDLPLSDKLGDWELKLHNEITYLQSGFYYAIEPDGEVICRYRGMDRDPETKQPAGLPYEDVLDILRLKTGFPNRESPRLYTSMTRFIALGLGLRTQSVWRSWERTDKGVNIDGNPRYSKRYHSGIECAQCQSYVTMYDGMHPMSIGGHSGQSYARSLPWRHTPEWYLEADALDIDEWCEMNPDWRDYGQDMDRWQ